MSVVVCPWCQSEITQEEGAEPEKFCPVCDNELGGYRTLQIELDRDGDEEDDADRDVLNAETGAGLPWEEDRALTEKNGIQLDFEEAVERLLDEQDAVPECPMCREYMVEAGEQTVSADAFRLREPEWMGEPVLKAPFSVTVYLCPSCYTVHHALSEQDRMDVHQRLSRAGERDRRKRMEALP